MTVERTHYEVLGVSETAPDAVVKAAHRALMKSLHPDTPTGDADRAEELNEAFRILSEPGSRRSYDTMLADR